jgi:nicotinamidase/pyrazinamidase
MVCASTVFWEVDAQADFMRPGGTLYVPGAEKILPNLNRLVEAARQDRVFLVSSADAHNPEDPEFREWLPHCIKGTPGAEIVPEGLAPRRLVIPNSAEFKLPTDLQMYQQVILEKNSLDVFDNPHTEELVARIGPVGSPAFQANAEIMVFGVVTECCVRCAVEGLLRRSRRVGIATDTIRSLDEQKGAQLLADWQTRGIRLISTNEAMAIVRGSLAHSV